MLPPENYSCAFCGNQVASIVGWDSENGGQIRVCPNCQFPTFFDGASTFSFRRQAPSSLPGRSVTNLPADVAALYEDARQSAAVRAYTASVLVCRKMLVDLAVAQGDSYKRGKPIWEYVDYLAASIFTPPHGKEWLDRIKDQGNKATHELGVMEKEDATLLITFIEMILRFLYEFPELLRAEASSAQGGAARPVLRGAGPDPKPAAAAGSGDSGKRSATKAFQVGH